MRFFLYVTFLVVITVIAPSDVRATSCMPLEYPTEARILLSSTPGSFSEYHPNLMSFSATMPAVLLGDQLYQVNLFVSETADGLDVKLIAPLHFEIQSEVAVARFIASTEWKHISLAAKYGPHLCHPSLSIDIDTRSESGN